MITVHSSEKKELLGLSTDEKPEGISENSLFLELDTGDFYYFGGEEWFKFGEGGGGGGDTEVWLVGSEPQSISGQIRFNLYQIDGEIDKVQELYTNSLLYDIRLNDEELPYFSEQGDYKVWQDDETTPTLLMSITQGGDFGYIATAIYVDVATAPTYVEVSVKAK